MTAGAVIPPWYGLVEYDLERLARRFPCPTCEAQPPAGPCRYPYLDQSGLSQSRSHVLRYKAAADAGLVPPLPEPP